MFLCFDFSRNLEFFVELINDLLEVHHLDAPHQPEDSGLCAVLHLPGLQDDADLLAGLHHVPHYGDDGLDAEPHGQALPVCEERELHAAPEDHVVTQGHLPDAPRGLGDQHLHAVCDAPRVWPFVDLVANGVPQRREGGGSDLEAKPDGLLGVGLVDVVVLGLLYTLVVPHVILQVEL